MDAIRQARGNLHLDGCIWERISLLENTPGALCVGWPTWSESAALDRLTWWPRGVPQLPTTALVSSRLGRDLDRHDDFFRVLRSACAQLDPERQMLISAGGTTTHRFVARAAELFGLTLLRIVVARPRQSLRGWLEEMAKTAPATAGWDWPCHVSPPLPCPESPPREVVEATGDEQIGSIPLRDRLVILAADQVVALHLRKDGNVAKSLAARLSQSERRQPAVFLSLGSEQLTPAAVADPLMRQGAVGWLLRDPPETSNAENVPPWPAPFGLAAPKTPAKIVPPPPSQPWNYLTHCTRRASGPWPDQSETQYLDELILGAATRDRSCLAALLRIVASRRILASSLTIRGGAEVVSLTEARLTELASLRTFRSHRARWDFEPYGICLSKQLLRSRGVRPVKYGDDAMWSTLAAEDRPFFQKASAPGQDGVDWRVEQEWRHLGDLELHEFSPTDALVFVPSEAEAAHLARVSRWPVTVAGS